MRATAMALTPPRVAGGAGPPTPRAPLRVRPR
ncbi:jg22677, partial [Pararge aegeria aegeria]